MQICRRPHDVRARLLAIASALSCAGCALLLSTSAWADWESLQPETITGDIYLIEEDSTHGTGEPRQGPAYFLLDVGQTLTFATNGARSLCIESRPLYADSLVSEVFRFKLSFGSIGERRFKRRSWLDGLVHVESIGRDGRISRGNEVLVGRVDKLAIDVPENVDVVSISMKSRDTRSAFFRVFANDSPTVQHHATRRSRRSRNFQPSHELRRVIELSPGGYDSNAYLTPKNESAVTEAFWPVGVTLDYRARPAQHLRISTRYAFDGQFHNRSVLDEKRHALEFGQLWHSRRSSSARGFSLSLEERLRSKNNSFIGRGDLEEFETSSDGETVSLADRFDYAEMRLRTTATYASSPSVRIMARAAYRIRDYTEDYEQFSDIYSLDYSRWDFESGILLRLSPDLALRSEVHLGFKNYKEKYSRDQQGNEIVNTPTSLLKRDVKLSLDYAPATGPIVALGLAGLQSIDRYQAYWDYTGSKVTVGAGWGWKRGHAIRTAVEYSSFRYENARLDYDPTRPLREKSAVEFKAEGRYRVRPRLDVQMTFKYLDQENNSPTFAYQRWMLSNGFVLRY